MYKHILKVNGEYLIKGAALPQNDIEMGANVVRAGRSMSGLEVLCVAKGDVTLTAAGAVTISVMHSVDSETFIQLPTVAEITISTDKTTFEDGEVIGRMTLPYDCMPYIKGNLGTDDAAATGSFDLILGYLPR